MRRTACFSFLVLWLTLFPLTGQILQGELLLHSELLNLNQLEVFKENEEKKIEQEEVALEILLDDARWIFSGMIYGYQFTWIPAAHARNIADFFFIDPLIQIPWGDQQMQIASVIKESKWQHVLVQYHPDKAQSARLEGWAANNFPTSGGAGKSPLGLYCRKEAIKEAIKKSLRNWLRVREYNKPQEIRGTVALTEMPKTGFSGPQCYATVRLKLNLDPVKAYRFD